MRSGPAPVGRRAGCVRGEEWNIKILDDAPLDDDAHEFTVELEVDDADGGIARRLWESAPDRDGLRRPHALVRSEGGRIDTGALRASLERFNEPRDDGWEWTAEALAAHLLHDLCGIAVVSWRYPPDHDVCPHGTAYSTDDGGLQWADEPCARCMGGGQPDARPAPSDDGPEA